MTAKAIPAPRAGETAEQYHRRLIDDGFMVEDRHSNASGQQPQRPDQLDRPHLQSLQEQLVAAVPEVAAIGNKSLREKLAIADPVWATDLYWEVKQRCIDDGLLLPGRGRGGSVLRATPKEQPEVEASWPIPTAERQKTSNVRQSVESVIQPKAPLTTTGTTTNAQNAVRQAFEAGVKAFNEGDFKTTLHEWGKLAEQGIPVAQYNIGLMHYSGRGVEKNTAKARAWFEKAAAQGHAKAQLKVGQILEAGIEADQDFTMAAQWYRKAADGGHAEAQYLLAKMLSKGHGIDKDCEQALVWFRKSAEQGNVGAAFELADAYKHGSRAEQQEHAKWALKAAELGHAGAQYLLYFGYSEGIRGFPKDGQAALKWLQLAAENGDVNAQSSLGRKYCCGDEYEWMGIKENPLEAARWLRLAANLGDLNAQEFLESLYQDELLPTEASQVFPVLLDAAEDGDCVAQYLVAEKLMHGAGVRKNITEAAKWYEASAVQGHPWAQLRLGHLYAEGKGVNQSLDSARYWYANAIEQQKPDGVYGGVQCNVQEEAATALMQLVTSDLNPEPAAGVVSPGGPMDMQWKLPTDWENALSWSDIDLPDNGHIVKLRVGAESGSSDCQNLLGVLYLTGTGVPFNMIAGQALFELAAAAGNKDAADNLIMSLNGGGKAAGVEKLAKQMSKPGKFLEALDKFVAYRESKRKARKSKA